MSSESIGRKVARAWFRREPLEINGQIILSTSSNPEYVLADYIDAAMAAPEQQSPRVCVIVCPTCKRNLVGIKAEDCECGQGYTDTYI